MSTKKQTRQRNARNRRNHPRRHHRKATCAKLFGAPVSTPISVPKSMQNRSEMVVLEVKTLPDRPLEPQGSPGGSPEAPQRLPGEPQGRPKGRPKPPKGSQKHPQERKIEAKTHPGSILKPMSVKNHIRSRFSIDFSSKSLPKPTCESMANFEEKFRRSCHRSTKRCCENHGFT